MRKFILLIMVAFPVLTFGQSYEGSYRAVFFNLFSEPRVIVTEFEIRADKSLNGKIKIAESVKTFSGTIDKSGKFEAVIEQIGNFTYKLKGKFDKNNKISLVQRNQVGSGLNKSVSESALEGRFSRVASNKTNSDSQTQMKTELGDEGKSWLKIEHLNPMFGTRWTDFAASVSYGNSNKTPVGSESKKVTETADASDYFVLRVKSKTEGQQSLSINVPISAPDKKSWQQNELRVISYREVSGEERNTFLASAMLQDDSRYAEGRLEIVRETEKQIVFKLNDFKIKRLGKEDFVVFNGFVYADK